MCDNHHSPSPGLCDAPQSVIAGESSVQDPGAGRLAVVYGCENNAKRGSPTGPWAPTGPFQPVADVIKGVVAYEPDANCTCAMCSCSRKGDVLSNTVLPVGDIVVPSGTFVVLMDGAYGDTGRGTFRTMRSDCKHYVKFPTANHFGPINWNADTQGAPQVWGNSVAAVVTVWPVLYRRHHVPPVYMLVTIPIFRLPSPRRTRWCR